MTPVPKAFISHATEDKDSFVVPFATRLRAKGVDAWVDQWEIKAGESLVDRIFESGIKEASVFIVVLSSVSVAKPWVRDELDSGVMRRISGQAKVIPIILDDVEVPVSLQHTLYLSVPKDGLETVLEKTVHSIFEVDSRPPLGAPPVYATDTTLLQILPDAADNEVFNAIIELSLAEHPLGTINRESLGEYLKPRGISGTVLEECVEVLESQGHFNFSRTLGGKWWLKGITPSSFVRALKARGLDVAGLQHRLLTAIVNDRTKSFRIFEDQPRIVTDALLHALESKKLISCTRALSGEIHIRAVSAEATRIVRRG